MKLAYIILAAVIALLFPFESRLNDGGTRRYEPVTGLYRVDLMHRINDSCGGFIVGTVIYISGKEVYNNSRIIYEN